METYEGFRSSGLQPGDHVSDGNAIVVAVTKVTKQPMTMEYGYVLCILPGNIATPWVSWSFNTNREDLDGHLQTWKHAMTYHGDYYYSWEEAVEGFTKRTEGWPIDNKYPPEVESEAT